MISIWYETPINFHFIKFLLSVRFTLEGAVDLFCFEKLAAVDRLNKIKCTRTKLYAMLDTLLIILNVDILNKWTGGLQNLLI